MANEWDKYIVEPTQSSDEWEQYAISEQPQQPKNRLADLAGGALGLGAVGLGGLALGKSGIPQAISRGIGNVASGVTNLPKVVNVNKGADFAQQIRGAFVQAHTDTINQFGSQLTELANKNPTKTVSLVDVVDDIVNNWNDLTPSTKSAIKNTPTLNKLIKVEKGIAKLSGNPSKVSLKATQDIINHLNTKVPANIRANNLDLLDTINNIKGSQLDAFPEMAKVRGEYAKFIEPYKQIKNYFKFNKLLDAIKNKFGGAEGQVAAEKILPKSVIKKMKGYRSAAKLAELPSDLPLVGRMFRSVGGALGVAPMVLQAIEFKRKMEEAKKKGMYSISPFGEVIPLSKEDLVI